MKHVRAALARAPSICSRKIAARLLDAGRPVRLEADAERPDGAGDERVVSPAASRAICAARALISSTLRLEPVLRELQPVRAEGVRLDDLGAGLHVRAVHVAHEVRRARFSSS